MNKLSKAIAATLVGVAINGAIAASPEHNTQAFLDALAAGGGKPLEQLSPADARAVLVGAQAAAKLELPKADVSEKTIKVDGKFPEAALLRVASADKIKQSGNAFLVEAGKLRLGSADFDNRFLVTVDNGKVVGKDLVVPARSEIRITYSWPGGHTH